MVFCNTRQQIPPWLYRVIHFHSANSTDSQLYKLIYNDTPKRWSDHRESKQWQRVNNWITLRIQLPQILSFLHLSINVVMHTTNECRVSRQTARWQQRDWSVQRVNRPLSENDCACCTDRSTHNMGLECVLFTNDWKCSGLTLNDICINIFLLVQSSEHSLRETTNQSDCKSLSYHQHPIVYNTLFWTL